MSDIDWGSRMHAAAERHLDLVREAYWLAEQTGVNLGALGDAPYCGCTTCDIRETLAGAWPVIQEMIKYEIDRARE